MTTENLNEIFKCAYDSLVDIDALQPNPKNPNKHPDKQIELLSKIIKYQGQRSPIVVSKRSGFVTKGHGRLSALKKLGFSKVAVDYQEYEDEAQEFADMIADNKIAELAQHDDEMLRVEALNLHLDISGFDLDLLGIPDFILSRPDEFLLDDKITQDSERRFILEIQAPNEQGMTDLYNEISERGFIVKVKNV